MRNSTILVFHIIFLWSILEWPGNREILKCSIFTMRVACYCSYCGVFQSKAASYSSIDNFKEVLYHGDGSVGNMIYPVAVRILLCWMCSGVGGNLQCLLQHRLICASQRWCCVTDLYRKSKYMREICSKHKESHSHKMLILVDFRGYP